MSKYNITSVILSFLLIICTVQAEEGMYPLSEIHKLNLKEAGLRLDVDAIYNPETVSLIDGICKVGGATGSFVSSEGLIITNHHVAFGGLQAASTDEHDYLRNGFSAETREQEIPAKGYRVRITESYRDVSEEVLSAISDTMNYQERTDVVDNKMKEIVARVEQEHPRKRASISEMFPGKTYVLFIYTYLKDIRLVYAPPRSIGNFGGEVDNWMWPRHTGDFSFLRAYVSPEGEPADYSPDNIPYTPQKVLQIAPEGVNENDFVFILGYPGRTYRHRTSHFLSYEQHIRMPWIVDYYQWEIDLMEKMGSKSRDIMLKHSSRIKWRSNTMKNYRGKLQGLHRIHLVDKKKKEEKKLQEFIESDPKREEKYGTVLQDIAEIYAGIEKNAERELILRYLNSAPYLLSFAYIAYEGNIERKKPDLERKSRYMDRNFQESIARLRLTLQNYYEPTDRVVLKELLQRAIHLPEDQQIQPIAEFFDSKDSDKKIDSFIKKAYAKASLTNEEAVLAAIEKDPEDLEKSSDPFIKLAVSLYPVYEELEKIQKERKGKLDQLSALLVEAKKEFMGTEFIPDANGTLRLTYGHTRGYFPRDAVCYKPFTTIQGIVEKQTGETPFNAPDDLLDLISQQKYGKFIHPELNTIPVDLLYDMDTTGGNSGSPIFDADGKLIGINFDRAYEATINDFAWNASYSRSIGVDIRYVLWILEKYAQAEELLEELKVLE
ncbi:MAG: S46 family peptidase [bacterium]